MKRMLLLATLALACASAAAAQTRRTRSSSAVNADAAAQAAAGQHEIAAGTRLAAQLQETLDVRKARVGDQVVLKTTQAIKQHGHTLVNKGARLVGRVTEVQQRAKGDAESRISLLFDRLESGALSQPISVTINSVTQSSAHASAANDDLLADTSAGGTTSASGGSSGGLLGGVGSTVGGVVNTTTQAAGEVVAGTTGAVGNTTRGVGQTVRGLRISQTGGASAEGGSTLSLTGGNLRLEKNTTFTLTLNESVNVGRGRDQ